VGSGGFGGGHGGQGNNSGNIGSGGGGGGGLGGAIVNLGGTVGITNTTLSGNAAVGGAGGAVNSVAAAPGSGFGGAIFNRSGLIAILNATIANNRADQGGGGIYNLGDGSGLSGVVSLRNTIVAGTPNGAFDYAGETINGATIASSGNHNLIQSNNGFSGGIVTTADPELGPLADNGGATLTLALLSGSPAIDAGDNTALPATDGRGYPRIVDGDGNGSILADIGAVEQGLFRLRTIPQTPGSIQTSGFQLFLTGEANRIYVTEFSPDLFTWTGFATNHSTGAEMPITDTSSAAAAHRFYRARPAP
jgi:hypothetical protein